MKGSIVLYVDLKDPTINPDFNRLTKNQSINNLDEEQEALNVPFNLISEGSYFGDSDCLY